MIVVRKTFSRVFSRSMSSSETLGVPKSASLRLLPCRACVHAIRAHSRFLSASSRNMGNVHNCLLRWGCGRLMTLRSVLSTRRLHYLPYLPCAQLPRLVLREPDLDQATDGLAARGGRRSRSELRQRFRQGRLPRRSRALPAAPAEHLGAGAAAVAPTGGQPSTLSGHAGAMTDPYSGLAFTVTSPDINSPGGVKTRQLLVIAKSLPEASKIADATILGATFEDSGPEILARAANSALKIITRGSMMAGHLKRKVPARGRPIPPQRSP